MHSDDASSRPARDPAPQPDGLGALRAEIDRLDDALLDLIDQRLAASHAVARQKQATDDGRLKLRPRREAAIVERLAARAKLASPELVNHVWRELMSFSLQAQTRTEMVLCASRRPDALKEQVRDRFGWAAPVRWAATPAEALEAARSAEAVAVIEHDVDAAWWVDLKDEKSLTIFDALWDSEGRLDAAMVGRVAPEDITDDRHFAILDEDDLARRLAAGEPIRPVAVCGALRLCIAGEELPR